MDSASANVAAGLSLEEVLPNLTFSRCAAHALDLLLEDISKLDWVRAVAEQGKEAVHFLRNHEVSRARLRCASSHVRLWQAAGM